VEEPIVRKRAIVYVDGFNLYYGSIKGSPYRWLDLGKLADLMLPNQDVIHVKYFTAIVDDPKGSVRQQLYISALESDGRTSVYRGHFLSHPKRRPRRQPCEQCGEKYPEVIITEEKGTDVNLATHLVFDACSDAFDVAAVISNDSDLATPIEFAINKCGKTVGVINPHQVAARTLSKAAGFYKKLRPGALAASQFPASFSVGDRTFTKPKTW